MTTAVPNLEYIEKLAQSIRGSSEIDFEDLCQLMFSIVAVYCQTLPPQSGPGPRKTYSDETILKIDMLMHLTGKRGETEILREIKRHYGQYFDKLPDQSRLWYRIRDALPLIERFRRWLRGLLGVSMEELRILDSFPIPVASQSSRPGRGNGFERAEGGYCAAKKLSYLGFKLGMLITDHGIPDVYDLFSAKPHDLRLLGDLLDQAQQVIAFGDKGFICDLKREELAQGQAVFLVTYRRVNQKEQNTPLEKWALDHYRQLIETVFSQLDGHMHIQRTGAKTDMGLVKRVVGIVTAFTLGIFLNFLLGRPLLAIKALFA